MLGFLCVLSLAQSPSDIASAILAGLNEIRDSAINPALHGAIPNPIPIAVSASGDADAGCIIPNPFGGCICHADAGYSAELSSISGVNAMAITNFTDAAVSVISPFKFGINLTAQVVFANVKAVGGAKAGVSACGISPSASGDASVMADGKGTVVMSAIASLNVSESHSTCISVSVSGARTTFGQASLHDPSVVIDLGPIPGINIGDLVSLVLKLAPQITDAIASAADGPIGDALPSAINGRLPCIPITF
jgi:hypothetical protein